MTDRVRQAELTAQLRQIESVHRGFLYQHLYATACLLTADREIMDAVIVEADEDIEIRKGSSRFYIQIKTRSEPLIPSDLTKSLARFAILREEHTAQRRKGNPFFCFIANQPPGPKLAKQIESGSWPADVKVIWPGKPQSRELYFLPPACLGIPDAINFCIGQADQIPHRRISAETLVWKLATLAMLAASGGKPYKDHRFDRAKLPGLFEQVALSLQNFPPPPPDYRLQLDEPRLRSEMPLRMIVGFSGAGKTAWASHAAIHSDGLFVYFDIGDELGPSLPGALANEIAATFSLMDPTKPLNEIVVASSSGLDLLRQVASYALRQSLEVTVVIDNAHRISSNVIRSVLDNTRPLKFILLAHPGEIVEELDAIFDTGLEELHGWSEDTIAEAVSENGAKGSPPDLRRLRDMTSGMPLYVMSAIRAAVAQFHGDIASFCSAVDAQRHPKRTSQEIILNKIYDTLPAATQEAVAALSFADVPLIQNEISFVLNKAFGFTPAGTAALIRTLLPQGILLSLSGETYGIHDAFRLIGKQRFELVEEKTRNSALRAFAILLTKSLAVGRDKKRLSMMIRAQAAMGDYSVLIGLAGEEMFHELGISDDIWEILEDAVEAGKLPGKQRFDALDGLVFRYFKIDAREKVPPLLSEMETLLEGEELSVEDRLSYLSKSMQYHAVVKNSAAVDKFSALIESSIPDDPVFDRIHRYTKAQALWHLDRLVEAEEIVRELVPDYMEALRIRPDQVFFQSQAAIRSHLRVDEETHAAVKHIADTLAFHAQILDRLGQVSALIKMQSLKFYALVGAVDSIVSLGMDVIDDFLSNGDPVGAKQAMEGFIMPAVGELALATEQIFVRSQYAVILARCGDHAEAESTLKRLRPYYVGLNDKLKSELMKNERIVQSVRAVRPRRPVDHETVQVGRNDPCPCGSGLKFKKCHGP
jgi:hypothetical protein